MPETPFDHLNYTVNEWHTDQFKKILNELPEKLDVVYDIGANAGGFTHVLYEKYPDAKFFCFEPIKSNFDYLVESVPFAACIQKGIYYGQTEGKATWRGSNIGAYFVEYVNSGEPRIFTGETMELTDLESLELPSPTLIKMDIEGAEENVLANSKICKEAPYLIIEWHPDHVPVRKFFEEHLPNHKIVVSLEDKQFLLALK